MAKIRILMVAGNMDVGGIENQLMHLARNINRDRFQVDFTSTMPDAVCREEIEALGGNFILIPEFRRKPFQYVYTVYYIMKNNHYHVVHSHELFHSGITLFIAWAAGVPCRFAHAHNWRDDDGSGRKRSLIRRIYNVVMRWMINTFSTSQIACSTLAGQFLYGERSILKSSYHLVYNSVDTTRFLDRDKILNRINNTNDSTDYNFELLGWKFILNVARISTVKNQIFLTEIARVLKERGDKICILCAGSGDENVVNQIKSRIKEYKIERYMILLGVRQDVDVLMQKCNSFILPSHYEGMPLVMIEAQASGLPCISADTYSHEVDFGLGMIKWMSLDSGVDTWADVVEKTVLLPRTDIIDIHQAIAEKKFDSKMFAKELADLYITDLRSKKGRQSAKAH